MALHPHPLPPLKGITIEEGRVIDRHFITDHKILVESALQSIPLTNPSLSIDLKYRTVYRTTQTPSQVSIISGCGSGHEPSFSGFVGRGFLTAAVVGSILSSPKVDQVQAALGIVDAKKGILAIIMNQLGDVANFREAILRAKAARLDVELVIVGDDVSEGRIKAQSHGRGGIAGTVLILKIAGALAATGASLDEVTRVAKLTSTHLLSVGSALSNVQNENHPLADVTSDEYLDTERLGIESERPLPGSHKVQVNLPIVVAGMLAELLSWSDEDRAFTANEPGELVLLVNNLGGLSGLELGAITLEIVMQLEKTYACRPVRIYSGTFMSSLDEMGFSVSLLEVVDLGLESGLTILELLDVSTETTGWPPAISSETWAQLKPLDTRTIISDDEV